MVLVHRSATGTYLGYTTDSDFDTTFVSAEAIDSADERNDDAYQGYDSLVEISLTASDDVRLHLDADDSPTGWVSFTPPTSVSWMLQAIAGADVSFNLYRGTSFGSLELIDCADGDLPFDDPFVVVRAERAAVRGGYTDVIDAVGSAYGGAGDTSTHSSLTVLPDGRPIVAYQDNELGVLRVAESAADGRWTSSASSATW